MQNEQTNATMQGIEFSFTTKLSDATELSGAFELIQGEDTTNDRVLPLLPANNARLALSHNFGSLWILGDNTFEVASKYVASQEVGGMYEPFAQYNTMPFGTADTQSYMLYSLGYTTQFDALNDKKADFSIKVNNLFDEAYVDFLDTYKGYALGIGRNVTFSLTLPF